MNMKTPVISIAGVVGEKPRRRDHLPIGDALSVPVPLLGGVILSNLLGPHLPRVLELPAAGIQAADVHLVRMDGLKLVGEPVLLGVPVSAVLQRS